MLDVSFSEGWCLIESSFVNGQISVFVADKNSNKSTELLRVVIDSIEAILEDW